MQWNGCILWLWRGTFALACSHCPYLLFRDAKHNIGTINTALHVQAVCSHTRIAIHTAIKGRVHLLLVDQIRSAADEIKVYQRIMTHNVRYHTRRQELYRKGKF